MPYRLLMPDIAQDPSAPESEACEAAVLRFRKSGLKADVISSAVYRTSVDARHRKAVRLVRSVALTVDGDVPQAEELKNSGIRLLADPPDPDSFPSPAPPADPPVVVGMGPAGIFAAYLLSLKGFRPVLIERGDPVEKRAAVCDSFAARRTLDPDSNIQFGAGGAGTFSDGKLVTRINDPLCSMVLGLFKDLGAPEDILVRARPHVGTDILRTVVSNADRLLRSLGCDIRYRTRMTGLVISKGRLTGVKTISGDIPCSSCVLATGHSADDIYSILSETGLTLIPKPFSVGVRIEHLTEDIDRMMYGRLAGHPSLGHAEYSLSAHVGGRGVYTFCMCPGGEVVCAATEPDGIVTNGMSRYLRNGRNSNSAVAVSVTPEDYGGTVEGAVGFRHVIERAAFAAGGGDFSAPAQDLRSYLSSGAPSLKGAVKPTYLGGACCLYDVSRLFPDFINMTLRSGFAEFERKMPGFTSRDAVITAPETRTSSPLRIPRDPGTLCAEGLDGLYPCGEGAGYAGGITSSAVDGLRVAAKILEEAYNGT